MSIRGLLQSSQLGIGQALSDATTWANVKAGSLTLDTLQCTNMYATNIFSGDEDQVPDVYYYGQISMANTYAGNTNGAGGNPAVSTLTFPNPFYDGPPGDPFAPSIHCTLATGTITAASIPGTVLNTVATEGYLAPFVRPFTSVPGQVAGFAVTVPATMGTGVAPVSFRQNIHWYAIGVPPQNPPTPWTVISTPAGAYDTLTNPSGWISVPLAGGAGYSSCQLPLTLPNSGVVGANPILVGAATIPVGGYLTVGAEKADFPIFIQPVAPTSDAVKSPQTPCPTNPVPVSEFWIQAVTVLAPPNSVLGGVSVVRQPVSTNITQALMLCAQGAAGNTDPYITSGATGGLGIRARIFTSSATSRNPDGDLYIQLLVGWGLLDPTTGGRGGLSRQGLTGWFGNAFLTTVPTTNLGNPQAGGFAPELTLFLGAASGDPVGTPPPSAPYSLAGTRWSSNEVGAASTLYQAGLPTSLSAGDSTTVQIWYSGNPNLPITTTPFSAQGNPGALPGGFIAYPTAGAAPPAAPQSARDGWFNTHQLISVV